MKPETILTKVLKQIKEQFGKEAIFIKAYGKIMQVEFFNSHPYIYIDEDIETENYCKLIKVNLLLRNVKLKKV